MVVTIILCALTADTLLIKIYAFTVINTSSGGRTMTFIVIGIVSAIGQYFLLEFIRKKGKDIRLIGMLHLNKIHASVTVIQFTITAILVSIFLQMITTTSYNNGMVIAGVTISYLLGTILMGLLASRFFSWFGSNRNLVIILYALSSAIIGANLCLTLLFVDLLLIQQPSDVFPHPSTVSPAQFLTSISVTGELNYAFVISSLMSFVSFWIATVFLLRHYSGRLGPAKYWIIVSIPLVYFASQFLPYFLDLFSSFRQTEPILFGMVYTVIFTLSRPAGGVLFGIAFWIVARALPHDSNVRDYLNISALGIVLLFTSNQAIILVTFSYPPFGIATISFVGLSSYLVLVGIYSSAISIAQDTKLRQSIRKITLKESRLLDSIGTAHMEEQLMKKVLKAVKLSQASMKHETGIDVSLDQQEITSYLREAYRRNEDQQTDRPVICSDLKSFVQQPSVS